MDNKMANCKHEQWMQDMTYLHSSLCCVECKLTLTAAEYLLYTMIKDLSKDVEKIVR